MADQVTQEIKDRLNIAEVIGSYIQLKRAGANYKAVCPFHSEKTPSFQVSPARQIWHCFGCGEGGDAFSFVMRYENVDFKDALKILAERAGVRLPEYRPKDPKAESEKELLLRINAFAARFYHELLLKDARASSAREYLKQRGLNDETLRRWQIGYAPDEFHALEQALVKKGVRLDDLVRAGVSSKNERGQIFDRFRGRITFPIFSYFGEAVGFSARILKDDGRSAKYLNSPETAVYSKSRVLFGLNFAKQEIRKHDEVVVVEGQMDCIQAHQAGFTNVVASSGTALTEEQLGLLGRLTKNLKLCFDADPAGLSATKRAVSLYLGKDFTAKVVSLPGAKDPDELIKQSPERFAEAVKDARLFLDFYLDKLLERYGGTVEDKKAVAREVLPLVRGLTDPIEREHYVKLIAEKLGTSEGALRQALAALPQAKAATAPKPGKGEPQSSRLQLEKIVLGAMLAYRELKEEFLREAAGEDFQTSEVKAVVGPWFDGGEPDQEKLDLPVAKEAQFVVESTLNDLDGNEYAHRRELKKSFALLKLQGIRAEQQRLAAAIERAEKSNDSKTLPHLNQRFAELVNLRIYYEKQL